jgi:hypothetical protein
MVLQQAASQALARRVVTLSPAAADSVRKLRNLLYDSATRDAHPPLCEFWRDPPDTWYPYGEDTECRIRHARSPGSEFRKGIHWTFQHNWSTKQHELSKELVDPIVKLLVSEAMMQEPEARSIVVNHYKYVYGHAPPLPTIPLDPSRTTMPLHPGLPGRPEGPLVPMPRPLPPDGELGPGEPPAPIPDADVVPPQPAPEEFPWMWVGIGAGALVLVGGVVYFATKK